MPVARLRPSGLKATRATPSPLGCTSRSTLRRVATSHICTAASPWAAASRAPSGLNARSLTASLEALSGRPSCRPLATSHRPTGTVRRPLRSALVAAAASRQPPAVRAQRDGRQLPGVALDGTADLPVRREVPQPRRSVLPGAREDAAVRADREVPGLPRVAGERRADLPAGGDVPQPDRPVIAGAHERAPIGRELDGLHAGPVPQRRPGLAGAAHGRQGGEDGPARLHGRLAAVRLQPEQRGERGVLAELCGGARGEVARLCGAFLEAGALDAAHREHGRDARDQHERERAGTEQRAGGASARRAPRRARPPGTPARCG